MKMEESPLEVLSRAVSIVQNENKAKKRHSAPPMASSDSGIEDDLTTECSDHSPRRTSSLPIKTSPKRDYDSDDSSQKSPGLFNAVKYFRKSPPIDLKSKHRLSPREMSPRQLSPMQVSEYEGYPHYSPRKEERFSPRKEERFSPRKEERFSPRKEERYSPRRESEERYSPRRESEERYSPRRESEERYSPRRESEERYSPKKESEEREQRSPERMDSEYSRYKVEECKRRSPKRPTLITDDKHLKKIKVEEPEDQDSLYESSLPVLKHCNKNKRLSPKLSEPRIITKPTLPVLNMTNERPVQVVPRYMHTYPPYPPLFILTDKPTNYSKLMETYDSIFAPKPPVLPPPLPAYTKCNCGEKNCLIITPPVYSPPPPYREKSEAADYGLPNVDEHFRKSLGEKYDIIKCQQANERPSSVDDHFAKALGQKWFKMEYGKKCTTKT